MSHDDVTNEQVLIEMRLLSGEFRALSGAVTSLARLVDRIDQHLIDVERHVVRIDKRLVGVEEQTSLIPGLVEAVMNLGGDIDNHEKDRGDSKNCPPKA